ncbi:MAG TPA: hypothetical protein VFH73_21560, partial [Polyangia bacterium]|nr:hypothetical protein [Polyangia bacterium]
EFTRWYSLALLVLLLAKVAFFVGLSPTDVAPKWSLALLASARSHDVAAAFIAPDGMPLWQLLAGANAAMTFIVFWYADRLKNRGWTPKTQKRLDLWLASKSALAVVLIFSLIYVSASVARL